MRSRGYDDDVTIARVIGNVFDLTFVLKRERLDRCVLEVYSTPVAGVLSIGGGVCLVWFGERGLCIITCS